jgi:hypothetical protein
MKKIRENVVVFATPEGVPTQLTDFTTVDCSRIRGDLQECFFDSLLRVGDFIVGFRLGGNRVGGHSVDLLFQKVFHLLRLINYFD